MTCQPWRRICRGTEWATLPGSRDAPTTAIVRDCSRICAGVLTARLYLQQGELLVLRRPLLRRSRRHHLPGLAGFADPDAVPARRRPYPVAHVPLVVLRRVRAAAAAPGYPVRPRATVPRRRSRSTC